MGFLQLLAISSVLLSCAVTTRVCRFPKPMDNFSGRRFSGMWFISAFDSFDPIDINRYEPSRCGRLYFHLDNGKHARNIWEVDLPLGQSGRTDVSGRYYLPDRSKGFLKTFNAGGNFTYDYTILCADYNTWALGYVCADVTPTYTSEIIVLMLRNLTQYDEVITYERVQRCLNIVSNKEVKDIRRTPAVNCSPDFYA